LSKSFNSDFISKNAGSWKDDEKAKKALLDQFNINYDELAYYMGKFENQSEFTDLYEFIANELSTGLDSGLEAIKTWSAQQIASAALKSGGFGAFIKATELKDKLDES